MLMKKTLRILKVLTPSEKYRSILVFIFILLGVVSEVIGVGAILPFVTIISDERVVEAYPQLTPLVDYFGITSHIQLVVGACIALFSLYLFKNALLLLISYYQSHFISHLQANIAQRLFREYLSKPYTYYLQNNSADLLRNVSNGVPVVVSGVLFTGYSLFSEGLIVIFVAIVLLSIDPYSTIMVTLFVGGFSFSVYRLFRKRMDFHAKNRPIFYSEMYKWLNQSIGAIKELKILHREELFIARFNENSVAYARGVMNNQINAAFPRYFIETTVVLAMVLIVLIGIKQGMVVSEIIPTLGLFAVAAFRLMPSMNRIYAYMTTLRFNLPMFDIMYDDLIMAKEHALETAELIKTDPGKILMPFQKQIRLEGISFKYPNTDRMVLDGINLIIPKACSIALVGSSGAGKTTLVDVIMGLLQPDEGDIYLDDINIKSDQAQWQRKIGYVPQVIYLTDDSVRRNVAFGVEDSCIDDHRVWECLRIAQLSSFIQDLPRSLDTAVGELGVCLSGGQRQRIGIARALYHDPEILIMDEATSALDNETEKYVSEAIDALAGEKTMIIIAHRLSTIAKCDWIYSVEDGYLHSVSRNEDLSGLIIDTGIEEIETWG